MIKLQELPKKRIITTQEEVSTMKEDQSLQAQDKQSNKEL